MVAYLSLPVHGHAKRLYVLRGRRCARGSEATVDSVGGCGVYGGSSVGRGGVLRCVRGGTGALCHTLLRVTVQVECGGPALRSGGMDEQRLQRVQLILTLKTKKEGAWA